MNGNVRRIVLWGLLIFYVVIILWFFVKNVREGLDVNNGENTNIDMLNAISGNANLSNQLNHSDGSSSSTPPIVVSGDNGPKGMEDGNLPKSE